MKVTCRHCNSPNEAQAAPERTVTVVCRSCGRPFTVYGAPSSENRDLQIPGGLAAGQDGREFGATDRRSEWEQGETTIAVDMEELDIAEASLDSVGGEEFGAYDDVPPAPPPMPGSPLQFRKHAAHEPATMRVDLGRLGLVPGEVEADDLPPPPPPPDLPPPPPGMQASAGASTEGWRVRNERGLVYNLTSIEAVIGWLEDKVDASVYQVSENGEPFVPVFQVPQLAERFGGLVEEPSGFGDDEESALTLALESDAIEGWDEPEEEEEEEEEGPIPAAERKVAVQDGRPVRPTVENPLGLTHVLWLLMAGLAAVAVLMGVGLIAGRFEMPPATEEPVDRVATTRGQGLRTALREFEQGRFTAAAELLDQIAKTMGPEEGDPIVFRYLAAAMHRTGRDRAARMALAEYRLRMARLGH